MRCSNVQKPLSKESQEVRSIFNVHRLNDVFKNLVSDERVLNVARSLLGSEVYVHQSRINYKPGLHGKEFFGYSDFETYSKINAKNARVELFDFIDR